MKQTKYSVVVVGSGIAGLYAAIKLRREINPKDGILLITKSSLNDNESNSKYAQGGMVCVLPENKLDSCTLHIEDTIKAGAGLTDFEAIKTVSEKSATVLKELLAYGVNFDRDENNKLKLTKEAAHSVNRIIHAGGDATGFCIENALMQTLLKEDNITIYEQTVVVDLLTDKNTCKGLISYKFEKDEYEAIYSSAVVLATGGVCQLYKYTTNPDVTTGDGIAIAYRNGAQIRDMEFIQFHPTAFSVGEKGTMFLISEAVRGEGAKLVHKDGMEFMSSYDERKELAPRDIVTRSIFNEMNKTKTDKVYLNATHISENAFKKRFPTIYATCVEYGVNPSKDYIPVSPAAHYTMGGIKTNIKGMSSLENLYAIGEAGCTGLHGANRLASNSILECVVTAYELINNLKTKDLNSEISDSLRMAELKNIYDKEIQQVQNINVQDMIFELKNIMWNNVGIIRTEKKLNEAKQLIAEMKNKFQYSFKCPSREYYDLRNLLTVAELVVNFAIKRKESRGAHFREDYPLTNDVAIPNIIEKPINERQGIICSY